MAWLTVLGVLVVITYYVVLNRRTKQTMPAVTPSPSPDVNLLTVEQARVAVEDILAKGSRLFVEPADKALTNLEMLGPMTREFFLRYGVLRTRRGGFELVASEVHSSEYVRGYISIGHSEDWDVVQRPGEDGVFVVEGAETRETEMEVRFPSVYHLVLDEVQKTE